MIFENKRINFTQKETIAFFIIILSFVGMFFLLTRNTRLEIHDAQRIADMASMRQALRLYKISYGYFPVVTNPVIITGTDKFSKTLLDDLVISKVFTDPVHPDFMYTYQSDPQGKNYILRFCLETNIIRNYTKGCDNTITP